MEKWQKVLGSTLAAVAIATAGCSGSSPFKNLLAKGDKPAAKDPGVVNAGRGIGHRGTAKKKGFTDSVASTWKSMTGKVSDALTIKPKEKKPADPLRLEEKPGPKDPRVFVATAELLERGGKFDQAAKQYERAIAADPKHSAALIGIARLHDRQGQFGLAEKEYVRAIKANPKQADYYNDLGLCLARQKKTDLAVGIMNKAVELDPQKVLYRNNLATVLVDQGNYDEALKHFTAAQDEAVAHYNLGYLLSKRNQNEAAIRHFRIASQMKPEFTQAHQMLARLGAGRPAENTGRTYRITDRTEVAGYTEPKIPTRLTSGVMLARLPATDESEPAAKKADVVEEEATTVEDSRAMAPASEKQETDEASQEQGERAENAEEEELKPQTAPADEPTDPRNSSFTPTQPDQMTPPDPAP